jgi:transcription initiation factor TFIID subunit TAF12
MQDEEDLILGEDVLEDALERMDANLRLEPTVEKALQLMAQDFAEEVVTGSAQLAKHREAKQVFFFGALVHGVSLGAQVSVNDMASHLLTQWGIRIPGFRSDTRDRLEDAAEANNALESVHRARMDIKATLQQAALEDDK